jgi:hypothetical protein
MLFSLVQENRYLLTCLLVKECLDIEVSSKIRHCADPGLVISDPITHCWP